MAQSKLRITARSGQHRFEWLRNGRDGNVQTLREMAALVRADAIEDLDLQTTTVAALKRAGVESSVFGRADAEIAAVFKYVQKTVDYRRDPAGGSEAIQSASVTLGRGFGDCDDIACVLATMLSLAGFVSRFVVIRQSTPERRLDSSRQSFEHVYIETLAPSGKWIALDACNKLEAPGWEPSYKARAVFTIFGDNVSNELEGFKDFMKGLGKVALKVAPVAAMFIPIPGVNVATAALIQGAIAGGSKIADQALSAKQAADAQRKAQAAYDAAQAKALADAQAAEAARLTEAARVAALRPAAVNSIMAALPTSLQNQSPYLLGAGALVLLLLITR